MPNTRHSQRQGMNTDDRLRLMEYDVDKLEEVGNRLADRLDSLARVGVGILSSLVVACFLLAANLVVGV